jgi:hypothetical protein
MWPFGKSKSRSPAEMYQTALRRVDTETTHSRPSWLRNSRKEKEKEFFDGVMALIRQGSAPTIYAAHGFMSPQSSGIMFSFAASMELQGASFAEQQAATAGFINQMWAEMLPHDKEDFLRATTI